MPKKDYQKKDFRNPLFPKLYKSKKQKSYKYFILFLFSVSMIGIYFLNTANLFQLENTVISGNEDISQQYISTVVSNQTTKKRFLLFSQKNLFFLKKSEIKQQLETNFLVASVGIKKMYPNTLEIVISEKMVNLVWVNGTDRYFVGLDGGILRQTSESDFVIKSGDGETDIIRPEFSSGQYPVIHNHQVTDKVEAGLVVLSVKKVEFVVELTEVIKQGADFGVSHYLTNDHPLEIILITKDGWEARFRLDRPATEQFALLSSILQEKVKNRSGLEYIDLRFGEKVFFK